jgi:C-terminal processing protease CtpA/Prc
VLVQQQWLGSGARVEGVDANSPAERAGLRLGDVIVGINGSPINNYSDSILSWRRAAGARSRPTSNQVCLPRLCRLWMRGILRP